MPTKAARKRRREETELAADMEELEPDLQKVLAKQAKISSVKRSAAAGSSGDCPTPYVDANAGMMRPRTDNSVKRSPAPLLRLQPRLHRAPNMLKVSIPSNFTTAAAYEMPDVVLVESPQKNWESPEALLARLVGARLVNHAWLQAQNKDLVPDGEAEVFCFQPVILRKLFILYVSSAFQTEHPEHTRILHWASNLSGDVKVKGARHRRLQVQDGPMPLEPEMPHCTWHLTGSKDRSGLSLTDLLFRMTWLQEP